ncbi:relaxase domain-containing protein [Oxalobacteraceae sp. CFBP 13708]|nr:relaxase domain-containing protein [Oxalobacteraceae sp. CFBP 13708]
MISMDKINNPKYLIEHSQHEYFTENDNEKGYFTGGLARFQKLEGKEVDAKTFEKLINYGKDFHGVELDPAPSKDWTVLYNRVSPKEREELQKIWNDSIKHLTKAVEQNVYYRETKNGKTEYKLAKAVCMAVFNHHTGRAVDGQIDPQEHSHIVVFPKVLGQDGKWHSHTLMDAKYEKNGHETLNYLDQVFQYHLCKGLQELGYTVSPGTKGSFNIDGVPEEVSKTFSKRTNQINKTVGEGASYNAKKKASLQMRATKTSNDLGQLRQVWQSVMDTLGFTHDQLDSMKGKQKDLDRDFKTVQAVKNKHVFSNKELRTIALSEAKFSTKTYKEKLEEFKGDSKLKDIGRNQNLYASNHAMNRIARTVKQQQMKNGLAKMKSPAPAKPSKLEQQVQQASKSKTSTPKPAAGAAPVQGKADTVPQCLSQMKSLEQQLAQLRLDDPTRSQIEAQIGELKERIKQMEEGEKNLDAVKVAFMRNGAGASPGTPGTHDFGSLDDVYTVHAKQITMELDNEKRKPAVLNEMLNKLVNSCSDTAKHMIVNVVQTQQKQKEELTI